MYTKHKWESEKHFNFNYVKYLPIDYNENEKYPLVFFLHGAGERGENLDIAVNNSYMRYVRENNTEYPFIFVAPQCPAEKHWGCYMESLSAFLEFICQELSVDEDRVYLTGLSMGGTGTWEFTMANPDKFAAIAPVCGRSYTWAGCKTITHVPIMMYHGNCDEIVPISDSMKMLSSINEKGGHAELKICYGYKHNSWDVAYAGDELWKWLLSHKKSMPLNVLLF